MNFPLNGQIEDRRTWRRHLTRDGCIFIGSSYGINRRRLEPECDDLIAADDGMHQRLVAALIEMFFDRQPALLQFFNLTGDLSLVVEIVDLRSDSLDTGQPRI